MNSRFCKDQTPASPSFPTRLLSPSFLTTVSHFASCVHKSSFFRLLPIFSDKSQSMCFPFSESHGCLYQLAFLFLWFQKIITYSEQKQLKSKRSIWLTLLGISWSLTEHRAGTQARVGAWTTEKHHFWLSLACSVTFLKHHNQTVQWWFHTKRDGLFHINHQSRKFLTNIVTDQSNLSNPSIETEDSRLPQGDI